MNYSRIVLLYKATFFTKINVRYEEKEKYLVWFIIIIEIGIISFPPM